MIILWLILSTILIVYGLTRDTHKVNLYNQIPGPTSYPCVGNILMFITTDRCELWRKIRKTMRKYAPICRFWLLNKVVVSVCDPNDLQILLSSQKTIEKGFAYKYLHPWLQTGLLTSTGQKWQLRRKMLTPAFHFGISRKYMKTVTEQAEKMIESLNGEGSETVKNLIPFFSDYTLNIICESTMGVALDKRDPHEVNQYKKSVHTMGDIFTYRTFRPFLTDSIFPYVPKMGPMQTKALKSLHSFSNKVIHERREYHKSQGDKFLNDYNNNSDVSIIQDYEIGAKKRLSMLDLLLAAEKKDLIENAGIQEEVDTFVLEGHDVTSCTLVYTLLLLAENKDVQNQAREEVTRVMNAANGKAGAAEVQEFQYLDRCIKETLRLFPPIAVIIRYITEDLQLKNGFIPANTDIMIHSWLTHRDPNYWPEPEKFDPDRFLPKNFEGRHPFCYIPFSAGPRNCIGQKFAMMEIKSMLGYILHDFYLEPIDRTADIPFVVDFLMRPRDPVHVKFVKINK